jgi:hypothetical protein
MTKEEIKQLADSAWERVWNDHLRNQEDTSINKSSFYLGFMESQRIMKDATSNHIRLWVIYDKPKDYPDKFVARLFLNNTPTERTIACESIEPIRSQLEQYGFVNIGRQPLDEVQIVEVWI